MGIIKQGEAVQIVPSSFLVKVKQLPEKVDGEIVTGFDKVIVQSLAVGLESGESKPNGNLTIQVNRLSPQLQQKIAEQPAIYREMFNEAFGDYPNDPNGQK